LQGLGELSVSTGLRSMARVPNGSDQGLVEVKAVDGAYPLYGEFEAEPNRPLAELLQQDGEVFGAVAAPLLLDRLGIRVGDELLLGNVRLRLAATVASEPDAISRRLRLCAAPAGEPRGIDGIRPRPDGQPG
jgi:putative ABC transport system permease protein